MNLRSNVNLNLSVNLNVNTNYLGKKGYTIYKNNLNQKQIKNIYNTAEFLKF